MLRIHVCVTTSEAFPANPGYPPFTSDFKCNESASKDIRRDLMILVVPHEAVPEVSKSRKYNPEEPVPIESIVCDNLD